MIPARAVFLAFLLLIAAGPLILPEFYTTLLTYVGLYSIVALGLVLLTGVAGLISLGHAAFVGLGAYTTAVLTTRFALSPWVTLPVALGLTAGVALILGFLTLRLSGHYLVLGTIAWSISLYIVFGNLAGLGGYNGIPGIPPIVLFGLPLESVTAYCYLTWIVTLAALAALASLLNSRPGRAIRALRSPVLAEAFGVHSSNLKIVVFVYSAVLAGLAGWLHAHYLRFVNPGPFSINASIEYLFMIVIGGASYLWGAVIGAGVVLLLKTWLQDLLPWLIGSAGQFEVIVFGLLIVVILHHASSGLAPWLARFIVVRPPLRPVDTGQTLSRRVQPARGAVLLEVERVTRTFGGLAAVRDVSLKVHSGEILGLIGPNGAGKTTLFNLISGILPLNSGQIRFRDQRIDRLPSRAMVRMGIARTFQLVQLRPSMSVIENVALGAHTRGHYGIVSATFGGNRAEEAKLLLEAARQIDRVGLGRHLHEPAGSLPLGQQRIVELARALAADPLLLLLDEPGAGLRYQEKQALSALLRSLRNEGASILLVEHDMDLVMDLVDRVVVMNFGQTISEGPPDSVQRDNRVIEAYLGT